MKPSVRARRFVTAIVRSIRVYLVPVNAAFVLVTEEYRSYKVATGRIMLSAYPFPSRIRLDEGVRVCTGASHRIFVSSICPMRSRDYKDIFGISSSQLSSISRDNSGPRYPSAV